ncbi:TRAP transporter substrate-binding protein [Methylobacterium sp. J-076]|uniref:TRAP transporter substrate-binding protein n=1 Tax=Methylobacterium sp. J-076 TaxID=2836655 RepID=UPI001FB88AA6|nr:TRAP transporter substrate-binding protein [Methylobacterium sp. J-076]MCJ2014766.1 TRAP transporter substrate-binding protein [Methylobacterium sp. J-076]
MVAPADDATRRHRTTLDRRAVLGLAGAAALGGTGVFSPAIVRAQGASVKLKFGNDVPLTHSLNVRLAEAISAIEQETNGRLSISVFPSNQLGSDTDMISQLRSGALELATMPTTLLSTLVPSAALPAIGFVFPSYDKVWPAMDGEVGAYMRGNIEKANLHPFEAMWDNGFRQITTSTKPIRGPEDLKGFKIRVPVVPLWVSLFAALGAAPTSIPLSEAYAALQTRISDGQENPLAIINATKFYEVQKFCSLTNHAWDGFWLLASGRTWRSLPAELRDVMAKHFNAAALKQREDNLKDSAALKAGLESKGLAFNTTDPAQFQQALAKTDFYKTWKSKFGPEAWALLEKYAGTIG